MSETELQKEPILDYEVIQEEFNELVSLACSKLKENRDIDIKILQDESKRICSCGNTINIPNSFKKSLYVSIFDLNLLDNAVNILKEKYYIYEHPVYIKKIIYLHSLLAAFSHEYGHIVQGHNFILTLNDSWKDCCAEYDADNFVPFFMRTILEIGLDIKIHKNKKDAIIDIMICSLIYLYYYVFMNLENKPTHPPFSVRTIISIGLFIKLTDIEFSSIQNYINSNKKIKIILDDTIFKKIQEITVLVLQGFQEIGCDIQNTSPEEIKIWLTREDDRQNFLDMFHSIALQEKPFLKKS